MRSALLPLEDLEEQASGGALPRSYTTASSKRLGELYDYVLLPPRRAVSATYHTLFPGNGKNATKKILPFEFSARTVGLVLGMVGCIIAFLFGLQQWISNANELKWSQKSGIWANCMSNQEIRTTRQCRKAFNQGWGGVSMWQMERFVWSIRLPLNKHLLIDEDGPEDNGSKSHHFTYGIRAYQTSLIPPPSYTIQDTIVRTVRTAGDSSGHTEMDMFFNMSAIRPAQAMEDWFKYELPSNAPNIWQMSNITTQITIPNKRWYEFYYTARLFAECTDQLSLRADSYITEKDLPQCLRDFWRMMYLENARRPQAGHTYPGVDMETTSPWSQLCRWQEDGSLKCAEDFGTLAFERWNVKGNGIIKQHG